MNQTVYAKQPGWIGASLIADLDTNEVAILAKWDGLDSFEHFRSGETYKAIFRGLSKYFNGAPAVQVNCVLARKSRTGNWTAGDR